MLQKSSAAINNFVIDHQYSNNLDYRGGVYYVEQILGLEEQLQTTSNSVASNSALSTRNASTSSTSIDVSVNNLVINDNAFNDNAIFIEQSHQHSSSHYLDVNSSINQTTQKYTTQKHTTQKYPTQKQATNLSSSLPLEHALALSSTYFSNNTIEAHNEAAFYTMITQALALCQLRNEVSYRICFLHNLALYFYTKAAPQLKYLKRLEDVLELSPKQRSTATCFNNLAFMRLSSYILKSENREAIKAFSQILPEQKQLPVFITTEIELLLALNQVDKAFETNKHFTQQTFEGTADKKAAKTVQTAYVDLHNYMIFQKAGNFFKAKQHLEQALQSFEQTACNRSVANCHHYLSELYENLGYYGQALEHIKLANQFEAKTQSSDINISELERLHTQFRKKVFTHKNNSATLN